MSFFHRLVCDVDSSGIKFFISFRPLPNNLSHPSSLRVYFFLFPFLMLVGNIVLVHKSCLFFVICIGGGVWGVVLGVVWCRLGYLWWWVW